MKKFMKDGKVAVLYSPGFGAGWFTWNTEHPGLLYDPEIVQAVLAGDMGRAASLAEDKYPGVYTGGAWSLEVAWLDPGTRFYVDEYDGSESIVTSDSRIHIA